MTIERQPWGGKKATGRWPAYSLIVDGVDIGLVQRSISVGCDRMLGLKQQRYDCWKIHGTLAETQKEAEQILITRALRFGHLDPTNARS